IPPAIFFYYSTLFDSRFKTLQQNPLADNFRKKKLTKTNIKELLEGKETLIKGIKNKEKKSYNAVVKIGEKGYIDFISFSKQA
ncbi:topoisomerase C-terminal repeat-containing protein, partial [Enterococcus faecium]|uniref:topoisomerase C-terminal repeat-containing protein n=1 Tax=Enterococcus faecium TaxID=1352 RepID=UPI003BA0577C